MTEKGACMLQLQLVVLVPNAVLLHGSWCRMKGSVWCWQFAAPPTVFS
jgi:hypothetical protein